MKPCMLVQCVLGSSSGAQLPRIWPDFQDYDPGMVINGCSVSAADKRLSKDEYKRNIVNFLHIFAPSMTGET